VAIRFSLSLKRIFLGVVVGCALIFALPWGLRWCARWTLLWKVQHAQGEEKAQLIRVVGLTGQHSGSASEFFLPYVVPLLDDPDPRIRLEAVKALDYFHGVEAKRVAPKLLALLSDATQEDKLRMKAADALAGSHGPERVPALLAALKGSDGLLRENILLWLSQMPRGDIDVKEALLAVVERSSEDMSCRLVAIESLESLGRKWRVRRLSMRKP
jgi:hypothetical protein